MKKIHFHSLDALRFFAFLKVYLFHLPLQGVFPNFAYLKSGGGIGVSFFFVLSGFLITYLLVFEKISNQKIDVKSFLIRRTLRIWPLFFLMVVIVFLLPYEFKERVGLHMLGDGYNFDWRYSFTFTENYKMLIADNFPKTTPLNVFWSLCIEEHFYLLWVISMFFIPVKHVFKFLVAGIVVAWLARIIEPHIFHNIKITTNELFTNLDFFACGGIVGYFVAKDYTRISTFINGINKWIKYFFVFVVILVILFQKYMLPYDPDSFFNIFRSTIIGILFALLVSIFIPVDSTIKIKNRVLRYLGSISFGLYVFHIIVIHCVLQYYIHHAIILDNWKALSVFIFITFAGTVLISSISYRFFEKPFLLLRNRLTKRGN